MTTTMNNRWDIRNNTKTTLLGKIQYIDERIVDENGKFPIIDDTIYTVDQKEDFIRDITDELEYDVPIQLVLFCDEDGNEPADLAAAIDEMDGIIYGIEVEEQPTQVIL